MTAGDSSFQRITIIGTGLIGGSWGMALRRSGYEGVRTGCDRGPILRQALATGAIDRAEEDLRLAVQNAGIVILAAPVGAILQLIPLVTEAAAPDALLTDTGSTKEIICQAAAKALHGNQLFLGGHPMAGKERSGVEYAGADLFDGAAYVLTPAKDEHLSDPRVVAFQALVATLGARVLLMNPAEHDRAAAWLSHLPQLASTALASVLAEQSGLPVELAASGFRDATRLADSSFPLWRDICATNLANIRRALEAHIVKLQSLHDHLADGSLEREFEQAQRLRLQLKG